MILHFRGGNTSENLSIIKETKKYIIKYLMETDFQENFRKGLENELYTLNELDRYTFFLERNYN